MDSKCCTRYATSLTNHWPRSPHSSSNISTRSFSSSSMSLSKDWIIFSWNFRLSITPGWSNPWKEIVSSVSKPSILSMTITIILPVSISIQMQLNCSDHYLHIYFGFLINKTTFAEYESSLLWLNLKWSTYLPRTFSWFTLLTLLAFFSPFFFVFISYFSKYKREQMRQLR